MLFILYICCEASLFGEPVFVEASGSTCPAPKHPLTAGYQVPPGAQEVQKVPRGTLVTHPQGKSPARLPEDCG
jgi:hypothetical protein